MDFQCTPTPCAHIYSREVSAKQLLCEVSPGAAADSPCRQALGSLMFGLRFGLVWVFFWEVGGREQKCPASPHFSVQSSFPGPGLPAGDNRRAGECSSWPWTGAHQVSLKERGSAQTEPADMARGHLQSLDKTTGNGTLHSLGEPGRGPTPVTIRGEERGRGKRRGRGWMEAGGGEEGSDPMGSGQGAARCGRRSRGTIGRSGGAKSVCFLR